jgi:hypothetical protein
MGCDDSEDLAVVCQRPWVFVVIRLRELSNIFFDHLGGLQDLNKNLTGKVRGKRNTEVDPDRGTAGAVS